MAAGPLCRERPGAQLRPPTWSGSPRACRVTPLRHRTPGAGVTRHGNPSSQTSQTLRGSHYWATVSASSVSVYVCVWGGVTPLSSKPDTEKPSGGKHTFSIFC